MNCVDHSGDVQTLPLLARAWLASRFLALPVQTYAIHIFVHPVSWYNTVTNYMLGSRMLGYNDS